MMDAPKPQNWFQRKLNNLGQRTNELGVATGATLVKDAVGGVANQAVNRAGEIGLGVQGVGLNAAQRGADAVVGGVTAVGRGVDALKDMGQNIGTVAKSIGKDILDSPIQMEKGGMKASLRERAQLLIARNANKLGNIIDERVIPFLKKLDTFVNGSNNQETPAALEEAVQQVEAGEATEKEPEVIEGQGLIDVVVGNLKAAVEYDQMKNQEIMPLIDRTLNSSEVAVKVTKAVMRGMIAVLLENSNFGGGTLSARQALAELTEDPQMREQVSKINILDFVDAYEKALKVISEAREKVAESRGANKNLSWKYEGGLIESSEKAQQEAAKLGLEIRKLLPEHADQLTPELLAVARGKGFEFSDKAKEAMRKLKHVALSLEVRFPAKAKEIQAKLQTIVDEWKLAKDVIPTAAAEMFDAGVRSQAREALILNIAQNESVRTLKTETEHRQVMTKLGIKFTGPEGDFSHEIVAGGPYANALEAFTKYAALSKAYELARDQVSEHPEAADRLLVLADQMLQAKYALADAKSRIATELAIEVRTMKNVDQIRTLQSANRTQEADREKQKQKYYDKMLLQFKDRLNREIPVIRRTLGYLAAAGVVSAAVLMRFEYLTQVQAAAAQAEVYLAPFREVWNALNVAVQPILEAGKQQGIMNAAEIAIKGGLGVAGVMVVRVMSEWFRKAGENFVQWRLGEEAKAQAQVKVISREPYQAPQQQEVPEWLQGAKPQVKVISREPYPAPAAETEPSAEVAESIASKKRIIDAIKSLPGMEQDVKKLEEEIIALGGTL
jgi:hypothetical protein